jgi:type VI secretion system secreted protein VgrG
MDSITQDERIARLTTPLGKDALLLTSFSASEGLSELFEIMVTTLSERPDIDFDDLIGQDCHIELDAQDGSTRIFHGVLTSGRRNGSAADLTSYDVVLRPWLWLLAHRSDCRFFLDKSVIDIVSEVFEKAGFKDFEFRTGESYAAIPYCVQYRETDLRFVSRLFEEHGIYYYFEHAADRHILVLADGLSSHKPSPAAPALTFRIGWHHLPEQYLNDWVSNRSYTTGRVELSDYDYLQPRKRMVASKEEAERYRHGRFELYDYPGGYLEPDRGEQLAGFRLEAEQAFDRRRTASGLVPGLFPGSLIKLDGHMIEAENGGYLAVRCYHRYSGQSYRSGHDGGAVAENYKGDYEFLPSSIRYRVMELTPKPRVNGIHTAKVVGKPGEEREEISTDKLGRVWVQFPWDRNKQTSCPIRVAHAWAGRRWGEIFIPRVGMEVVVEYVEGNPDRPLIVGCVYNGDNDVPYALPENKTKAGWKSDSSIGHQGYNEIVYEDKKGSEQIGVHAQRNLNVVVLASESRSIGGNLSTTIGNSEKREIGKAFKIPAGSPARETTIKMGDDKLTVESGNIVYEAKLKIELKVGPSTIRIEPTGITIEGPTLTLKGIGPVVINGLPVKLN